jgi:tetratricopeptide (TPR) repeat protein
MPTLLTSLSRRLLRLVAGFALAASLAAQTPERNYNPSDATAEALPKYKEAMDAKPPNFAAALAVLNGLQAKVPANSYDAALIHQYKLQIYLQQGDFAKAIEPMEKSLALSEANSPTFFDERVTRELYFFLVQLYFQEAAQTKNTTLAASYFDKADKAMEHWLKITPQTNAEAQLIYAQLLFSRGMLNAANPDQALLKRAIEQVDIGLKLSIRPKDTFYVLKLVSLNQLDRYAESSELLETLLKLKPDSAAYWQQLAATYLAIAAKCEENKQPQRAREYNIRSIISIERAQANGFMKTPKDNYNLVGIYFNIAQFEKAAELLTSGLKTGDIENDPKNWELLALCWQQLQRPLKGIEALKEGTRAFPKSGQLEFLIAQGYTAVDNPEESLKHIQVAIAKGNLAKPYQAYLSLAYTAYSLQKYDIALDAARKATEYPEGVKDGQNMADALSALIKDREAKKNKS